jgi:hypothetical protein
MQTFPANYLSPGPRAFLSSGEPMPKIRCRCDYLINLSDIPCPDGYLLLSERDWDQLSDDVENQGDFASQIMQRAVEV